MSHPTERRIFDLHCDTLTECTARNVGLMNGELRFSLNKLSEYYRLCQAMAVFIPDEYRGKQAEDYFDRVYAVFQRELSCHENLVNQVQKTDCIDYDLDQKKFALMLTVEGGAVLAGKLESLYKLKQCGVKIITLTWNGANEICGGSATDLGFTPFGRRAVRKMEALGIAVDVSHLSDRGFYELCEFATVPFLATHSNSRAVCPHARNLTDEMFRIIAGRGGVVGLNYYNNFIVEQGTSRSIDDLLRHVHHFLELGGENALALGSDFDGADMPPYLDGLDRLEYLVEAMSRSGIPDRILDQILYRNALRYFSNLTGGNQS